MKLERPLINQEAQEDARWACVEARVARILERAPAGADRAAALRGETERTVAELNDQLKFYLKETAGKKFDGVRERLAVLAEMEAPAVAQIWRAYAAEQYPGNKRIYDAATLAYMHVDDDYDGWHHNLSDKVSFNLTKEGNVANLHLGEAQELSAGELKSTVLSGFGGLAKRLVGLEADDHRFPGEELGAVKEVRLTSWIVREHPRIIEKGLGFTIDDRSDELSRAERTQWGAVMSRDDFVPATFPARRKEAVAVVL